MDLLSDRLLALRKQKKLSREEAAELLHVDKETLARYERGNRVPQAEFISEAARVYEVSADYLLGLSPTEQKNAPAETMPGEGVKSKISDSIFDKKANKEYFIPMYKYSILRLHGDGDFQSVDYELVPFPRADLSPDPARPPFMVEQDVSFGLAGRGISAEDRAVIVDPAETEVQSGRFYLISLNGEVLLRQLYRAPDGGVIAEGDNGFRVELSPAALAQGSLRILGRAVMKVGML